MGCAFIPINFGHGKSNRVVTFYLFQRRNFRTPKGIEFLETYNAMNWKKFVLLGWVIVCVFAASSATAQMRGRGSSMPRMGMRGGFMPRSMARMPMQRGPMFRGMGPMSMRHAPMRDSAFGFHRFNDRDFDRDDRFRRFHRFNDGDFDRDDGFRHFHHFNDIFIFDTFGFPFFPFFLPPPPFFLFPPF
jgi:hypothetical protein